MKNIKNGLNKLSNFIPRLPWSVIALAVFAPWIWRASMLPVCRRPSVFMAHLRRFRISPIQSPKRQSIPVCWSVMGMRTHMCRRNRWCRKGEIDFPISWIFSTWELTEKITSDNKFHIFKVWIGDGRNACEEGGLAIYSLWECKAWFHGTEWVEGATHWPFKLCLNKSK